MAADPRALVRVLDELLWALRRDGFEISTAQAIDIARALEAVGFQRRERVRDAIACLVVRRTGERARFDASFARFFDPTATASRGTLWQRLEARGFARHEIDVLRELLAQLTTARADGVSLLTGLERGADLDRLLARSASARSIDAHSGLMLGYLTHRVIGEVGTGRARRTLAILRPSLTDALGERGQALADALGQELEATEDEVRTFVRRTHEGKVADLDRERGERHIETTPFTALTEAEIHDVRRVGQTVRRAPARLGPGARLRRACRGRFRCASNAEGGAPDGRACPYQIARTRPSPRSPEGVRALRRQRFCPRGRGLPARVHLCRPRALRASAYIRLRERARGDDTPLRARACAHGDRSGLARGRRARG